MRPIDDRIATEMIQMVRRPLVGMRSAMTAAVGDWNSSSKRSLCAVTDMTKSPFAWDLLSGGEQVAVLLMPELLVGRAAGDQFVVRCQIDDAALVKYQDGIAIGQ